MATTDGSGRILLHYTAVYHNRLIASPPLDFGHLFNHISHSSQVRAATIRSPFGDVELAHVMSIVGLQEKKHLVMFFLQCMHEL